MVVLLLVWSFCLLLSSLWGLATLRLSLVLLPTPAEKEVAEDNVYVLSLVGLAVLAAFASFLTTAGLNTYQAFAVCIAISAFFAFKYYKPYLGSLGKAFSQLRGYTIWPWLFILIYSFAFLITSAGPSEIGDEGGYHLPILVMLEQVGLVRGIGNLNHHIPLCSNWHVLNSLLGFGWLFGAPGHGFYDLSGYISVLFVFYCATYIHTSTKSEKQEEPSTLRFLALLLPMLIILSPITSPTNDIPAWVFTWVGCMYFLEAKSTTYRSAWLIPIFILGGILSIKITHAPMALIPMILMGYGLVDKKYKEVGVAIAILAFLNMPTLLRSLELSGYLLFPIVRNPFGELPWLVPSWWAINANNPTHYNLPANISKTSFEWIRFWFTQYYKPTEAVLVSLCMVCMVWVSALGMLNLRKQRLTPVEIVHIAVFVSMCILFFAGSPEPRYGLGFIGIGSFTYLSVRLSRMAIPKVWVQVMIAISIAYGGQKLYKSVQNSFNIQYTLSPSVITTTFQASAIGGNVFFRSVSCEGYTNPNQRQDCDCWNSPFPCSENLSTLPPLLGKTPAEGFKTRTSE